MAPEPVIQVVLIDPTGRVRTPDMAVLMAAGMRVRLVAPADASALDGPVDVVVADLRPSDIRPAIVLRLAFRFQRPVVVVTTVGQVDARLAALRHGAVDHVVTPTDARELVERVRHAVGALRSRGDADAAVELDRAARTLRHGTRITSVTPAELAVLEVLMDREGEVVSKADISAAVPGSPLPNTVEVHLSALRRKLESIGGPTIRTVHRQGYVYRVPTATGRADRGLLRVADLVAQRERLVHERDAHVRRRDEILQHVEQRRADEARDHPPTGRADGSADGSVDGGRARGRPPAPGPNAS